MKRDRVRNHGKIFVWQGGSLWLGRTTGATDIHAHHAIQISIALEGSFRLRAADDSDWRTYTAAVIPSHQSHAFSTSGALVGNIFIEPEAAEGRVLLDQFGSTEITPIPTEASEKTAAVLISACEDGLHNDRLIPAAQEVVRLLTGGAEPAGIVDPRIHKAIELVKERLAGTIQQEEIAEAVYLSPSRFRHLFVLETGMAFRSYVLWLRLQRALEEYVAGETLTTAAHAAGFADLAHMSRTFRRMFGISPTIMARAGTYAPLRSRKD